MKKFEGKNNDAERIIADLKGVENNLEQQLKKREQELENFEAELIFLKIKTNEESI